MSGSKANTCIVMAGTGYAYRGLKAEGYMVYNLYRGRGLFLRILREICFRVPFLPKKLWYNRTVLNPLFRYYVVWDALTTVDYLKWLKGNAPEAQINFIYNNLAGNAKNLMPGEIPSGIRIWTYDESDAEKYGIRCISTHPYFRAYLKPLKKPEYDIFFVGRDKGRLEYLQTLEKKFRDMGLRTQFIIVRDTMFSPNKRVYQKELPYPDVVEYLRRSRAVLNIPMKNQTGVTLRDIESAFFGIKLITTNANILECKLIRRENVFILGKDNPDTLKRFIETPPVPVDAEVLRLHSYDSLFREMTDTDEESVGAAEQTDRQRI